MRTLRILKNKKGFTLIEMIVVLVVIVILIAIAVPAVAGYRASAQETADQGQAEALLTALEAASLKYNPIEPTNLPDGDGIKRDAGNQEIYTERMFTKADLETSAKPFLQAVNEMLGDNFDGFFTFQISGNTGAVNWITYRPSDVENTEENIMVYEVTLGKVGYLDEIDLGGPKTRDDYYHI